MSEIVNRKTITAHMIVKNEERWIWFSIMSVIDHVDKMIIFDTGSIDSTVKIIKDILLVEKYKGKIIFEEKKDINKDNFYLLRQEQLERTNTDYFLVVDGDEIWYKTTLLELHKLINSKDIQSDLVAIKFVNCAGDIYHYRNFNRETYCIKNITGSITVRLYSMQIKGIKCAGIYGIEGYFDENNKPVQESKWHIEILEGFYIHMSLLQRSGVRKGDFSIAYRRKKLGADWDCKFDENFKYPEVFYLERPKNVWNPWAKKIDWLDKVFCILRKGKRMLFK